MKCVLVLVMVMFISLSSNGPIIKPQDLQTLGLVVKVVSEDKRERREVRKKKFILGKNTDLVINSYPLDNKDGNLLHKRIRDQLEKELKDLEVRIENNQLYATNTSSVCDGVSDLWKSLKDEFLNTDFHQKADCFSGSLLKYILLPYLGRFQDSIATFRSDEAVNDLFFSAQGQSEVMEVLNKYDPNEEIGSPQRDYYTLQYLLEVLLQTREGRLDLKSHNESIVSRTKDIARKLMFSQLLQGITLIFSITLYVVLSVKICCCPNNNNQGNRSLCSRLCGKRIFEAITELPESELQSGLIRVRQRQEN